MGIMAALYEQLAEQLPGRELMFLNYGYAEAEPGRYDWVRPEDWRHRYHLSLVRHVLEGVELDPSKSVLEIGSGRGGNCYYLLRYTTAGNILGVDACAYNVRLSRRVALDRATFLLADAEALPFATRAFDVVLNIESSHCYADFGRFLSEVFRVLKPRGVFACADLWDLRLLPWDWAERAGALYASGFELLAEEDISEPVFAALKQEDGFSHTLLSLEQPGNGRLVRRLVQENDAMRLTLAAGQCSYKRWYMRKP